MIKTIIIDNVDFSNSAIIYNDFTWGHGGIYQGDIGNISGKINDTISTTRPVPYTTKDIKLILNNSEYFIHGVRTNTTLSSENAEYVEYTKEDNITSVDINAGMYYQIAITKKDNSLADLKDGTYAITIKEK